MCEPAVKLLFTAVLPAIGDQVYVYVPPPPLTVTDPEPLFDPKQFTLVCVGTTVMELGVTIVAEALVKQPLASVMVADIGPPLRPVATTVEPAVAVKVRALLNKTV